MHKVRRAKRKKKSTLVDKKYAYMQRNMQGDENMLVYDISFIIVLQTEPKLCPGTHVDVGAQDGEMEI